MPNYLVTWEIELEAVSPEDAAYAARLIQLDPDSTATFFVVTDRDTTKEYGIDLED